VTKGIQIRSTLTTIRPMPKDRSSLKRPATAFALSLVASILAFIFIGFPGICGFTGKYGDAIARSDRGFWIAMGLFSLPILGIIASAIWWLGALLLLPKKAS
jgi:NADH:ubiquinone oxidoreductase subunit 2 (subunit N)